MKYKEEIKAKRLEAAKNFSNPFKIGDIIEHSWGYDQTNIDFYQIMVVKPKSVVLKPIKSKAVLGTQGFMSQNVIPEKDSFIEKLSFISENCGKISEITKKVGFLLNDDGSLSYYIPTPHGWADKWKGTPHYESWYA